jgi:hypothetical protein
MEENILVFYSNLIPEKDINVLKDMPYLNYGKSFVAIHS